MPSQKECNIINDRMMLSRARRDARAEHCQRIYGAKGRIDERREQRQVRATRRAARQAAMCRVVDGALMVVCLLGVLAMLYVGWA